MSAPAISFELVAPYGTLVNCVVSDRPRGDNTAEFTNIRGTLEKMGRPQVAIDHSARVRQAQLLDDGGSCRPLILPECEHTTLLSSSSQIIQALGHFW
jgi:hypothetical protein